MIFTIVTSHGDYNHRTDVLVADGLSDIEAYELVQSHSAYTPDFHYDPSNSSHSDALSDFIALRQGDLQGVYSPNPGWVAGWSWTWIIRPDLEA